MTFPPISDHSTGQVFDGSSQFDAGWALPRIFRAKSLQSVEREAGDSQHSSLCHVVNIPNHIFRFVIGMERFR